MKKMIFVAATAAILAMGCQKEQVLNQTQRELGFSTEIGKQSKAINTGITFENSNFGVFAYALQGENDVTSWNKNENIKNKVMDNVEIKFIGDPKAWRANDGNKYYWPNDSKTRLNFFAYSPYNEIATPANGPLGVVPTFAMADGSTKGQYGIKLENYVNSVEKATGNNGTDVKTDRIIDFMYGRTTDQTFDKNNGAVNMTFKHALTQVIFKVKQAQAYPSISFKLQSIKLKAVSKGTFTELPNPKWATSSEAKDKIDYTIFSDNSGQEINGTMTAAGAAAVMIPQSLNGLTFEVVYNVSGTGVANETVTKTIACDKGDIKTWDPNQKVSYNLTIGLNEITFTPSVGEWTEASVAKSPAIN